VTVIYALWGQPDRAELLDDVAIKEGDRSVSGCERG
jgi:hypothetical protein